MCGLCRLKRRRRRRRYSAGDRGGCGERRPPGCRTIDWRRSEEDGKKRGAQSLFIALFLQGNDLPTHIVATLSTARHRPRNFARPKVHLFALS